MATKLVGSAAKPPNAGKGRKKGVPNKTTALLKDAILQAATAAGGGDLTRYLADQAIESPTAFLSLLGKVLPLQMTGLDDGPVQIAFKTVYETRGN